MKRQSSSFGKDVGIMKIKLSNNFGTKVLSVAIALILWFIVGNINDPVKTKAFSDIPVKIINEDVLESINKVYEITEGDTVTVAVRGKKSIVENLRSSDFTAVADLSKLSIVNAVPIDISVSKHSDQLEVSLGRVNTMKVKIEDRKTAMIPVTVETSGEVADGFAIGSKTASPNLIEVSGSETSINRLKEVKVKVDVDGVGQNISTRQKFDFYDKNGDRVESGNISCDTKKIDVYIELWRTKEISLRINTEGKVKSGYGLLTFEYEPKTVTVAGAEGKTDDLNELVLDPVDIEGQSENLEKTITIDNSVLPSGVIFPDGIVNIVAKAVIAKKEAGTVKIQAEEIAVRGLKPGKRAEFEEASYLIKVDSLLGNNVEITGDQFFPYIDVNEIDPDTGQVQVHLTDPRGVMVTSKLKVKVSIR